MLRLIAISVIALLPVSAAHAADLVFLGEHIVTMDPDLRERQPTAVAVTGEKIVWTGARGAHHDHVGPDTQVIELGERALVPGFIDAHGHFTFASLVVNTANVASPPVGPATDIESLQAQLFQHIDERNIEDGAWVIGFGYDDSLLAEGRHPTRADLDAVSTTHPIALMHVSGHLATANSRALEIGGISADTQDPPGGHIRRDANGEPNGVLEESATGALRGYMMANPNPMESLQRVQEQYASYGITTVQEGYGSPPGMQALMGAAAAGLLNIDVVAYPGANPVSPQHRDDLNLGVHHERLKIAGVKISLDGSPQGKTAYLTQPYHVPPLGQNEDYRGYPSMPQSTADAAIGHFLRQGVPMLVHANGDAAGDMLIGAVRRGLARLESATDHRTVMIHAQTARRDQVQAMAELSMIPSYFSAHTFYWGDWHRDSVLGPVRGANISPAAWTLEDGGRFTVHNDTPVVPADMIRLLWATTNRRTRSDQVLGEGQRVSTYAALRAMTLDAAYQSFDEDRKGSITVGKQADLVILDRNPLLVARPDLLSVKVLGTWSRGVPIFAAE